MLTTTIFTYTSDDPQLSSKTVEHPEEVEETTNDEVQLENIRKKLKTTHQKNSTFSKPPSKINVDDEDEFEEYYLHMDRDLERKKKM